MGLSLRLIYPEHISGLYIYKLYEGSTRTTYQTCDVSNKVFNLLIYEDTGLN